MPATCLFSSLARVATAASRLALLVVGGAVVLGLFFGPSDADVRPADLPVPPYEGLRPDGPLSRVYLHTNAGRLAANLILHDPSGTELLEANYHAGSRTALFLSRRGNLRGGILTTGSGRVALHLDGPQTTTEIAFSPDGSGELTIKELSGRATVLGRLRISPSGQLSNSTGGPGRDVP